MEVRHFLNMYSYARELEKEFKNGIYVTIALQAVKDYMAELFITVDLNVFTEKEFFERFSSKTSVKQRIKRTLAFEKFVKQNDYAEIVEDELLDLFAEGTIDTLKILYDKTKTTT